MNWEKIQRLTSADLTNSMLHASRISMLYQMKLNTSQIKLVLTKFIALRVHSILACEWVFFFILEFPCDKYARDWLQYIILYLSLCVIYLVSILFLQLNWLMMYQMVYFQLRYFIVWDAQRTRSLPHRLQPFNFAAVQSIFECSAHSPLFSHLFNYAILETNEK